MPARSILHLCALQKEFGSTMERMRTRFGKRGLNLDWINYSDDAGTDYRSSIRKKFADADAVIFLLGQWHGPEVPEGTENGPGLSYLEYAAQLAFKNGIQTAFLLADPGFPVDEISDEPEQKRERQKEFRSTAKRLGKFVRTVKEDADLDEACSKFRQILKGRGFKFPWKLACAAVAALAVFAYFRATMQSSTGPKSVATAPSVPEATPGIKRDISPLELPNIAQAAPLPNELANAKVSLKPTEHKPQVSPADEAKFAKSIRDLQSLIEAGKIKESLEQVKVLMPNMYQRLGKSHGYTIQARLLSSQIMEAQQSIEESLKTQTDALRDAEAMEPPNPKLVDLIHSRLADTLLKRKRPAEAEPYLRQALEFREQNLPPDNPQAVGELSIARYNLADCLLQMDRPADAVPLLEKCMETALEQLGQYHPQSIQIKSALEAAKKRTANAEANK